MKISPANFEVVGDFLAYVKKKQYFCNGFEKTIFDMMKKIILISAVLAAVALASCNVTRTITTSSEAYKRGDTSVVIQTKTIETYDASKKLMY